MPCTNTNDGYNNLRDGDNKQIRIIYVLIGGEWVMACVLYWQGPLKYMFKTDLANLVMKNSRWKSIGMYTGVDGVMRKFKLENPSKRPQSDTSPIPGEGCYLPDVFPRPKAWLSKADAVFGAKGPTLTKVMAKSKENDTRVYGQAYVEENIGLYK